jgi:hypothetical protein
MSRPPSNSESVEAVREYFSAEIGRAQQELTREQWQAILAGVNDLGDVAVYPCRLILPFHYPATIAELDENGPDHFAFPEVSWNLRWQSIREFAEQYEKFSAIEDDAESVRVGQQHLRRRIKVLQDGCAGFDPGLTIIGIESDSEEWWEPLTFHVSGPRIPPPPSPVSDVQILSRLRRQTQNYIGKSAFGIEDGVITEVRFDGACTTDATFDLLRGIPNLRDLLKGLRRMSLESTLATDRSLRFLKRELPHVEIAYSHYLEG